MRLKSCVLMAGVGMVVATSQASAAMVAYWAFPEPAHTPNYAIAWPVAADQAAFPGATLDTDAPKYDGSAAPTALQQGSMQYFAGSLVNIQAPSVVAGQAMGLRNDSLNRGEGKSIIMHVVTTGFTDLFLSFAERYTAAGPTGVTVQYSTDGVAYTAATSYATVRDAVFAAAPRVVDLSAIDSIENLPDVYLKITFTGFNVNSTGAARLDNILVSGVPTPGALALLGVAGVVASRRRRS
jgi:MYXO-CTERM domain-containing protein